MGHGDGQEKIEGIINCYDERDVVKEVPRINGLALLERSNGGKIVGFNPQVIMGTEVVHQHSVESLAGQQDNCRNCNIEEELAYVPSCQGIDLHDAKA